MAFEAYTDGFKDQNPGVTPGKYLFEVTKVDENGGTRGEMIIEFEVLDAEDSGVIGEVQREYFAKTAKAMWRIHHLAIALGMVTKEDVESARDRGEGIIYDFESDGPGKKVLGETQEDEYQGKIRNKLDTRIYYLSDTRCKTWKVNPANAPKSAEETEKDAEDLLDGVI